MARLIESIFLEGPAGRLEALHESPDETVRVERAVVVCHPHPLHGGTMHNKVVYVAPGPCCEGRQVRKTTAAIAFLRSYPR